ncbi:hypothetical protein [Pseudomonas sp. NPDC089534]|uniref:hypothetical protein n=1 Tax=Pseudomonas sp. NPDC089534 TaxID=3364468 RepID=UPI0037F92ED0
MSDTLYRCDGRIAITVEPREMRMSHWVHAPKVVDLLRGQALLDLRGGPWDLLSATEVADGVELVLRRYPGEGAPVRVSVCLDDGSLKLDGRPVDAQALDAALR